MRISLSALALCVGIFGFIFPNRPADAIMSTPQGQVEELDDRGMCFKAAMKGDRISTITVAGKQTPACVLVGSCNLGKGSGMQIYYVRCLSSSKDACPDFDECLSATYKNRNVDSALRDLQAGAVEQDIPMGRSVSPYPKGFDRRKDAAKARSTLPN
jgi:hypothetical protein